MNLIQKYFFWPISYRQKCYDKLKNEITKLEAYQDGLYAAYRIEKYEGYTLPPGNPYPDNSIFSEEWNKGFSDGIDDICSYQKEK